MLKYTIILISLVLFSCKSQESKHVIEQCGVVKTILNDIVIEGKSKFKLQKDQIDKKSWRIGLVKTFERNKNSELSKILNLDQNEYFGFTFKCNAGHLAHDNVDINYIEKEEILTKGVRYYSTDYIKKNNLDAIIIFSDLYKTTESSHKYSLNVSFFWNKNFKIIKYDFINKNNAWIIVNSQLL